MLARALAASVGRRMTRSKPRSTCSPGTSSAPTCGGPRKAGSTSSPGPSSQTWCWWTRSTGRPRRPSPGSSSRWRSGRSPSMGTARHHPTVHGHRHAEPDSRPRRHLRIPAGVARPFPGPCLARLSVPLGGDAPAPGRAPPGRDRRDARGPAVCAGRRRCPCTPSEHLLRYVVDLLSYTREHERIAVGASPRAGVRLLERGTRGGPPSWDETTSFLTTSRRSPRPCSPTGCRPPGRMPTPVRRSSRRHCARFRPQ